jgi:hypothetical protein
VPDLPKLFSQLGLSKSLQRVKFGGVVGKQTYLGIFGVGALAVIAFRADSNGALIIGVVAALMVLIIAVMNYIYASNHPVEAMMEGGEMLALQHQQLAAKGLASPPASEFKAGPLDLGSGGSIKVPDAGV